MPHRHTLILRISWSAYHVCDIIFRKVRCSSLCFTAVADEVAGCSNKEWLSIFLRYVELSHSMSYLNCHYHMMFTIPQTHHRQQQQPCGIPCRHGSFIHLEAGNRSSTNNPLPSVLLAKECTRETVPTILLPTAYEPAVLHQETAICSIGSCSRNFTFHFNKGFQLSYYH